MRSRWIGLGAAALALALPWRAQAFCGFYVAGADDEIFNEATMVVLLREGTTTVLSMQNDYRGPTEDFAMVVPVPVVLDEDHVQTLPREVFDRIDHLAAPRLVEYWEQDPCAHPTGEGTIGLGNLGTIGHGAGGGSGYGSAGRVVVEAEFAVGEYDIVILSAEDSGALDTWLREHEYRIPEGADEVLRPYVARGMKFFVARVDASRVTFEDGRAVLSPLRVHYESDQLRLPVRLGLLSSSGTQDLVVHVLARNQRYEMANYENVTIPTNLDVAASARDRFGEVYAALFDRTLAEHPGAVVTEYAWQATGCDPCPGPVLTPSDLATLGADVAPATAETPPDPLPFGGFGLRGRTRSVARIRRGEVEAEPGLPVEVIHRIVRRHLNEVRFCYEQALARTPDLEGRITALFTIQPDGATHGITAESEIEDPTLMSCVRGIVGRWRFPAPDNGPQQVTYPFVLTPPSGGFEPGSGVRASPYRSFVLTRLHYRYDRDGLDEDLVFRAAPPIIGGREMRGDDGQLEQGARQVPHTNNFQARYAIRHPWEGEIDCEHPVRGDWGGPPDGQRPRPAAARHLASVTRGAIELDDVLESELDVPEANAPEEPEEPEPAAEPAEAPAQAPASSSSGCGCRVAGSDAPFGASALALLALCALLRRRRRRRSAEGAT